MRRTAGHTVLFSSLTIAAAMATLAIFPERFVYSMGIAGADRRPGRRRLRPVRPAVAPDRLRRAHRCAPSSRRHAPPAQDEAQTTGRWYRIATVVMRRPALWALSAVLVLVVLAAPFLHVSFTGADASAPAGQQLGRHRL